MTHRSGKTGEGHLLIKSLLLCLPESCHPSHKESVDHWVVPDPTPSWKSGDSYRNRVSKRLLWFGREYSGRADPLLPHTLKRERTMVRCTPPQRSDEMCSPAQGSFQ